MTSDQLLDLSNRLCAIYVAVVMSAGGLMGVAFLGMAIHLTIRDWRKSRRKAV